MEFSDLWSRAKEEEPLAREQLCEELRALANRFAFEMRSSAYEREDLIQEVITSVLKGIKELDCPRNLSQFVKYRLWSVSKTLRNRGAKFKQVPEDRSEEEPSDVGRPEDVAPWMRVGKGEDSQALQSCLDELPERQRDSAWRRYAENQTVVKIAEDERVSPTAIYKRIEAAFRALLACLQRKGVEL